MSYIDPSDFVRVKLYRKGIADPFEMRVSTNFAKKIYVGHGDTEHAECAAWGPMCDAVGNVQMISLDLKQFDMVIVPRECIG